MRPGTLGDDAARVVLLMTYCRSAIRRTPYPADRDTSPAPRARGAHRAGRDARIRTVKANRRIGR